MKYNLGDILYSVSDKFSSNKDQAIFLNTSDIKEGEILINDYQKIIDLPGQAKKSIKNGDILYSEIRPKNKRYALVNLKNTKDYVVSTKLMVLRNIRKDLVSTKYIFYFLTSNRIINYLQSEAESRSGTFPQITYSKNICNIEIDIPSIKEQNKIVGILDSLSNKIGLNNEINANLAEQLNSTFSNIYSLNYNYNKIQLEDLIINTISGDWGKSDEINDFNRKVKIIRGTDIKNIEMGFYGNPPTRFIKDSAIKKKVMVPYDVLLEISGGSPTQSTGRSLLITKELISKFKGFNVLGTNFTRIFRTNDKNNAILFKSYIQFLYDNDVFFNYENGTTGIKNLDYKSLLKMKINDVRDTKKFKDYVKMYDNYYSFIQKSGIESIKLMKIKNELLNKLLN
ncbi:restriction endonuclease subunit S [Fructilactobacillus frigidiflavus]|uniref:restriction endonuclease subunit S n=1 Tax=Fructilactobacillus frigidiflavus TaxID=3242688 RepID=UPI0037568766